MAFVNIIINLILRWRSHILLDSRLRLDDSNLEIVVHVLTSSEALRGLVLYPTRSRFLGKLLGKFIRCWDVARIIVSQPFFAYEWSLEVYSFRHGRLMCGLLLNSQELIAITEIGTVLINLWLSHIDEIHRIFDIFDIRIPSTSLINSIIETHSLIF